MPSKIVIDKKKRTQINNFNFYSVLVLEPPIRIGRVRVSVLDYVIYFLITKLMQSWALVKCTFLNFK